MTAAHRADDDLAVVIAEDAENLAVLHDRELTAAAIAALQEVRFPFSLGLIPSPEGQEQLWPKLAQTIAALPQTATMSTAEMTQTLDTLAAAYAEVYLTGALGVSPFESAWLDDDHLLYQAPMFALRSLYQAAGLVATNWRKRAEDHLVMELLFVRHLASAGRWHDLAHLLDQHLLLWLPDFAQRLMVRQAHPFYALLAAVTTEWAMRLRQLLANRLDTPCPTLAELKARFAASRQASQQPAEQPIAFVPGNNAPSW